MAPPAALPDWLGERGCSVRQRKRRRCADLAAPHGGSAPSQVRYMQILKETKGSQQPYRWVRYVTMSNSYVVRT